ncbi:alpha-galactosidase [Alloscardovia theropitheci]|uniref:alpha-galactosidase n=1 Tax=Alloscardovia theropitheci TaxID=2496842 RepID=A0A4R0QZT0_9BIFI|nr:alpha-galactosidase [Alloscardovia theropitheci]TCD54196.1 alpha-galactosidase [Alloscardovia theropitheci]
MVVSTCEPTRASDVQAHVYAYNGEVRDGKTHEVYTLENGGIAVTLSVVDNELPRIVYWGRAYENLSVDGNAGVSHAYEALKPQRVSGGLDDTNFPTILPVQAEGWTGAPRFVVTRDGREIFCHFSVTSVEANEEGRVVEKFSDLARSLSGMSDEELEQAQEESTTYPTYVSAVPQVTVEAEDAVQGVRLVWTMQILDDGLVRQRATVSNTESAPENSVLAVNTLELSYPVPANAREILTTAGHHLRERHPQRQDVTIGRFERVVEIGRPDFDATLLLNVGTRGFDFEQGEVFSTHVGWSGNSITSVEQTVYTLPLIGGGEHLYAGEVQLTAGTDEEYASPWVYGSYGVGLNEVAQRFHAFVRQMHPNFATKPRPVILNTWEAVYFEHNIETLKQLADNAARCGVERFVVDDGWFGSRRDDTSGLGDWYISQDVWPDGSRSLKALAEYVHGLGMEFGLWFEPEMANIVSELNEKHPEWILAPSAERLPMQGRSQQVVDLSNPDALAYIFNSMDALVGEIGIDYIKWDHNKLVTEPGSAVHGYAATQRKQVEAVYAIFDALKIKHNGLEIESCSSGGGRIDLGILERADRVWTSDCVDPVERADIQRYTSLLVPEIMMGEHVGASPAHSTLRATSLSMRAATALFGHLGIEWNLNIQPQEELDALSHWVDLYKKSRPWAGSGLTVHGDVTDESVRLDGVISADRTRALYRFAQVRTSVHYPTLPVRLPGVSSDTMYRVRPVEVQKELTHEETNGQSELLWWNNEGIVISGAALVNFGLRMPQLNPQQAVVFSVEAL